MKWSLKICARDTYLTFIILLATVVLCAVQQWHNLDYKTNFSRKSVICRALY